MKKVFVICLLLTGFMLQAQSSDNPRQEKRKEMREKMKDLTPQQRAELRTKKMVLHLDLNEAQAEQVLALNLEVANKREQMKVERKKGEELSTTEIYDRKSRALDEKIAMKKRLKEILTPEQFEKFEKGMKRRGVKKRKRLTKRTEH